MLSHLWSNQSKLRQLRKAAQDKDITILFLESGDFKSDLITIIADAQLQRAAITSVEYKIAYYAYKGFLELGRGAIFILPVEYLDGLNSQTLFETDAVYIIYYNKQQIVDSRTEVSAEFKLIDDLLLDKIESYNPETEAVIEFFLMPAVVLIQFQDFQVKPEDCYRKLASLEACLS